MAGTSDHSYENIQNALQAVINRKSRMWDIAKEYGMGERTLGRYAERLRTGQPIRGVHSRRGTSALFRIDEHGKVQFEVISHFRDRRKAVTIGEVMEQLEKVNEKLSTIAGTVKRLETKLKELQME
ncbi:hypothetical protein [Pasteurella multocida]|uniref:hypothetical protein n=1 Tax=Pasteurella multocida TaxID=747 RepID=UPI002CD1A073|nr:hypothetical protein [Pasteurella multocida]MEB3457357.1 hypothetical protein [Pasteurella multocida]HDR1088766.1 hypothetical protein [Pasteurella multocida]